MQSRGGENLWPLTCVYRIPPASPTLRGKLPFAWQAHKCPDQSKGGYSSFPLPESGNQGWECPCWSPAGKRDALNLHLEGREGADKMQGMVLIVWCTMVRPSGTEPE